MEKGTEDTGFVDTSQQKFLFVVSFLFVFITSSTVLYKAGLTPEFSLEDAQNTDISSATIINEANAFSSETLSELNQNQQIESNLVPTRIVIDSVGIDTTIESPESTEIGTLDKALLSGAVHYPGSGTLDDNSNMFLFGHSSFLPTVNNQNFRAFNNLEKTEKGDTIRVESGDFVNMYRVESIRLTDVNDAFVELSSREKRLTLSTCNSFGDSSERYVVEASFVGSYQKTTF